MQLLNSTEINKLSIGRASTVNYGQKLAIVKPKLHFLSRFPIYYILRPFVYCFMLLLSLKGREV